MDEQSEEDRQHTQHEIWTYKFIANIPLEHIEYMLIDAEAKKPYYISDKMIDDLRNNYEGCTGLRLYYSERFNTFMVEPYK